MEALVYERKVRAALPKVQPFTPADVDDLTEYCVVVNANTRSALRAPVDDEARIEYIMLPRAHEGTLQMQVRHYPRNQWDVDWKRSTYSVKKAATAYAAVAAITGITEEARQHLERILGTPLTHLKTKTLEVTSSRSTTMEQATNAAPSTTIAGPDKIEQATKANKKPATQVPPNAKAKKAGAKPAAAPKKSAAKKVAPKKPAAKPAAAEPRTRTSKYSDKTIKPLVKNAEAAGLRAGSKRAIMLDFALKQKNTDDVLGATVKVDGVQHTIGAANLNGMIERKHIAIS